MLLLLDLKISTINFMIQNKFVFVNGHIHIFEEPSVD